jgi:hypothetical protein
MWDYLLLAALIAVGVWDIVLVIKGKDTLSQRYHRLLPQWADMAIMIALLILIGFNTPDNRLVYCILGVVMGHLGWHERG